MRSFVNWIRNLASPTAKPSKPQAGLKRLIFRKGSSVINLQLTNGDRYDSTGDLLEYNDLSLWHSEYVNLDHTVSYAGGILQSGDYWGIVGYRQNGQRAIFLFKKTVNPDTIKNKDDLTEDDVTLPSSVPNPNHGGKPIIRFVLVHAGGRKWDYSHGCLTVLNIGGVYDFDRLMNKLEDNEIIEITVR